LIFSSKESYISLLSFQQEQSSKLFHTNEELCLLQELVKKTKDMLKYPNPFGVNIYRGHFATMGAFQAIPKIEVMTGMIK